METILCKLGEVLEKDLKFAVISASYNNKWVFVKHKERNTWEIPGGHREAGECINEAAERELFEESGGKAVSILPICEYGVVREGSISFGRLFYAEIDRIEELPDLEIGEVKLFTNLPEELTYPNIQPYLFKRTQEFINSLKK